MLLVDLDPQACLTFSLGLDPESLDLSVHDVLLGRVSASVAIAPTEDGPALLPSTIDLAGAEAMLLPRTGREYVLRSALEEVAESYDDVLLDCAPSLGVLTINALTAADEVLIPLQCETLSHRGVGQLLDTVQDVQRLTNRGLRVRGVLPTLFDGRTTHARSVVADVASRYGLPMLDPPIPKSVRFAEAPAAGPVDPGHGITRAGCRGLSRARAGAAFAAAEDRGPAGRTGRRRRPPSHSMSLAPTVSPGGERPSPRRVSA